MGKVTRSWRQLGHAGVAPDSAIVPPSPLEFVLQAVLNAGVEPADFMGRERDGAVVSTILECQVRDREGVRPLEVYPLTKEMASTMTMTVQHHNFFRAVEVFIGTEALNLLRAGRGHLSITLKSVVDLKKGKGRSQQRQTASA